MATTWIIFVLSFLFCIFAHVTTLPYQESSDSEFTWSQKNSKNDADGFRSISYGRLPAADEFNEIKDEYEMDDVDFDNEEDGYFEYNSITNNKRSPNSVGDRSYKNKAGYFLIERPDHTIEGTTDITKCNNYGVFQAGKTNGVPFLKNKASGRYLAITNSGYVYTRPDRNADTEINNLVQTPYVYMYRIVTVGSNTSNYRYLDISPTSSTVSGNEAGNTTKFKVRFGKTC